jgi:hypothetical protein
VRVWALAIEVMANAATNTPPNIFSFILFFFIPGLIAIYYIEWLGDRLV